MSGWGPVERRRYRRRISNNTADFDAALARIATGWRIDFIGETFFVWNDGPGRTVAFASYDPASALDRYYTYCAEAGAP